ncbi:MAG: aspartate 1-decarboxylase [Deltaproteobacteria bacterium]|jgi:aspartate 1-decarboxylase|nr:aspartate 1-decarboxylase [Deltaproteobacteria bacterium]
MALVTLLKSKIHRAVVQRIALDYNGSVSIDGELMRAAGLYEHERVLIANVNNGQRFETYCLASAEKGLVCLNGAAARLAAVGDLVIIMAFAQMEEREARNFQPRVVKVDGLNRPVPLEPRSMVV